MLDSIWSFGVSKLLNYAAAILLICNIIYVIYTSIKKKVYYDNIFITFAIYFTALIVEPISASIKFNTKYGYEVIDLFYFAMIGYIIVIAILRNNNFFMYNMAWDRFYGIVKEILHKKGIETYYRKPTIYLGNGEASISHSMNLFSKRVIVVKISGLDSVQELGDLKTDIMNHKTDDKLSKYYYLLINVVLTVVLLLNIRY
ncbi:MAG: hypothetical protein Q4A75_03220 [Peptostreptococcaceae bacterium]|nr:hypothetical protein [Peptostreptococcaceae bacterium]